MFPTLFYNSSFSTTSLPEQNIGIPAASQKTAELASSVFPALPAHPSLVLYPPFESGNSKSWEPPNHVPKKRKREEPPSESPTPPFPSPSPVPSRVFSVTSGRISIAKISDLEKSQLLTTLHGVSKKKIFASTTDQLTPEQQQAARRLKELGCDSLSLLFWRNQRKNKIRTQDAKLIAASSTPGNSFLEAEPSPMEISPSSSQEILSAFAGSLLQINDRRQRKNASERNSNEVQRAQQIAKITGKSVETTLLALRNLKRDLDPFIRGKLKSISPSEVIDWLNGDEPRKEEISSHFLADTIVRIRACAQDLAPALERRHISGWRQSYTKTSRALVTAMRRVQSAGPAAASVPLECDETLRAISAPQSAPMTISDSVDVSSRSPSPSPIPHSLAGPIQYHPLESPAFPHDLFPQLSEDINNP